MKTLHNFLQQVHSIYSPGATLWLIGDGHVFSDCSESFFQKFVGFDIHLLEEKLEWMTPVLTFTAKSCKE